MSQVPATRDESPASAESSLEPAKAPTGDASWHYHATLLSCATAALLASFLLSILDEETVGFTPLDWRMPGTCISRNFFQVRCPGCGLTRSFISIAHGDLFRAWHFNPAGPLLFAMVLFQIPFRAIQLWRMRNNQPLLEWHWLNYVMIGIGVALVGQWLLGLIGVQF